VTATPPPNRFTIQVSACRGGPDMP
jgi:hypothetical protein